MKSFLDKFFFNTSRYEFLFIVIPFLLWIFSCRYFFNGHLHLEGDGPSYADHIGFYTDNLSKGIYPLWDPTWPNGAPNDFFLRRIGDVNPLLFLIVVLKWFGVSSAASYLYFLGVYYFLAGWAFYLITRFLLKDRFFAFTAYILLLFSSWGFQIFYNYIIIIFVPIVWFFYFLLSFSRTPHRGYFLGMFFCAGLIVTTYIPFFFLTILTIFSFLYALFYGKEFFIFLKLSFVFINKNKFFTFLCAVFLMVSCVPGLMLYKESKAGEFVLPNRHAGADASSAVAVGIQSVASGDIISHGYFDRIFDDHQNIDMGDIYLPYVFFLILLVTACGRVNKLILFLLFNILSLSLITITSATGVHRFLYQHVIIFKFIRNIYYFFWLGMLPMGILLSVSAFKSLLTAINGSSKKIGWLIYITICHLIFVLFLLVHPGVLWGAWAAVLISLSYFLIYFFYENKVYFFAGFFLLLLAVFIQSAQVYQFLDNKLFQEHRDIQQAEQIKGPSKSMKLDMYYTSSWFAVLTNYIDPQVFDNYRAHKFILYDLVVPYEDSQEFFKTLQTAMSTNINVAFIARSESKSDDWRSDPNAQPQADLEPVASGKLSVLPSDVNTWKLKAHLSRSQFLVINDNYNSGWRAYINGHPARLFRANVSFKGLWVPSGDSNIVLRFSNTKEYVFHIALIVLFGLVFLYLLMLVVRKKKSGHHV